MMAGTNDLLWDFTETAPGASPVAADNNENVKLTYGSKVDDAAGTNNGLKGVKLDSKGYAYFTKAAVAGKLKLTFGPRKNAQDCSLKVSTWAGETPSAETEITTTATQTESNTQVVELTEAQNNIYIQRGASVETVLTKIEFTENVARSFVDFKVDFRNDPYTVLLPTTGLPAGVTITGTFHDGQHGYSKAKVTVPVDGPVRFTIGSCTYTDKATVTQDGVDLITEIDTKAGGCDDGTHFDHYVTYTYTGGPTTLYFNLGAYCPFFFAEACEVTPCTITFKDQNGGVLGTVETIEGANLEAIPYTEADLPAVGEGNAFRGWYYTSGKKANVGDPINGNTTISAKVTPIEVATVGSIQTYDFTSAIFYPEDHETIDIGGGYYHDGQHGWAFKNGDRFAVSVAGKKAIIVLEICQYGTADAVWKETWLSQVEGVITPDSCAAIGNEGEQMIFKFSYSKGDEDNFALFQLQNTGGENYLHKVTVYNVEDFVEKDETTSYIMVPTGDAASFIMALTQAQEGDKIFLPNGLYDLGETVLTTISKNNISIIGQSMDGVIIKNAPDAKTESIDKTATLRIAKNVTGTYIQDLTIQNALDYYKSDNGRAVALWDQGTKTVCKNVKLLSYQDTYYSNLQGAVKYFEDCEIHGTVDFICGDGSVYFKKNLLYCEKRKASGGGSDALTANNGPASDRGYVFDSCVVVSECPVVSFGRAWNNTPSVAFLNTQVSYDAGKFSFESSDIQRWTKKLMNPNAWPKFGEYNTQTMDGTVLTPASNIVTFVDEKSGNATRDIETVLSAEQAAAYTMEYTLGEWAATALNDAKQAVCEEQWADLEADAIYLAEADGKFVMLVKGSEVMDKLAVYDGVEYTLRKANARGGFGWKAGEEPHEAIENTAAETVKVQKIMRDGQVIIVRDGKEFNVLGAQL